MKHPLRVTVNDRLSVDGREHRLTEKTELGCHFEAVDETAHVLSLTFDELHDLLKKPNVEFEPGYFLLESKKARMSAGLDTLASMPEHLCEIVGWRSAWVDAFLQFQSSGELKRTDESIVRAMPSLEVHVNRQMRAAQRKWRKPRAGNESKLKDPPSPRTLREWVKRFENAGCSPFGLVPQTHRCGNRSPRFCLEATRLMGECIEGYLTRDQAKRGNVVEDCIRRFTEVNAERLVEGKPELRTPSSRKVERDIAKLDPYFTCVQREGVDAANRAFALYEEGIDASYPMERIEIDEWCVDLITILAERGALDHLSPEALAKLDRGRRWLYLAIDCATRCVVGMRLSAKPNLTDAVLLLSDVTRDKTDMAIAAGCKSTWHHYGGLSSVVTDLGVAFVDSGFRQAVFEAHGIVETPRGGLPHLRARVERIFRTFGTLLMPRLAGRTFSNTTERGDYPSEEMASLTDDVLMELLIRFVVDRYHNLPHRGLNGETPNNCWKRLADKVGIVPILAETTRRRAFGVKQNRSVNGKGVRVFGIDYTCAELRNFHLHSRHTHVDIKVDLNDLGWIMVQIGNNWVVAQALQKRFEGVSYEQWEAAARELRQKHKAEAALHAQTVSDALDAIIQRDAEERRRFGAVLKRQTPAGLKRAREDLFVGLSIKAGDPEGFELPPEPDLFGYLIPFSDEHQEVSETSADDIQNSSEEQPRASTWRFEDD